MRATIDTSMGRKALINVEPSDFVTKPHERFPKLSEDVLTISPKEHKLKNIDNYVFSTDLYQRLISTEVKDNTLIAHFGPNAAQHGVVSLFEKPTYAKR
jgi:hypothetical protein